MTPAIRVQNLSKCYRIGAAPAGGANLSESLRAAARGAWGKVRRLAAPGTGPAGGADYWALRDVTFDVAPGDVVGIIGRNGAGKSTLLKLLSRITGPTAGRVEIRGRVGSLLEVGTGFHPELTGRENVYLNGSVLGMARAEIRRQFDAIVGFADIGPFLDTPVKRYSSGMYVRLAFAVAAHLRSEVLIVDEVLAVGDAQFQQKCLGTMRAASRGGRTVLFVSHSIGTVRSLCRTAVWLVGGKVAELGPAREVTESYVRAAAAARADSVDLDPIRERVGGDAFRLTALAVNDGGPVAHDGPLVLRVRYRAVQPVVDVAVGVGLNDPGGVRIMTFDSDLSTPRRTLAPGAEGEVVFRVARLPLQPGTYTLDLGARSGDRFALDYLPPNFPLEVVPGPATPGFLIGTVGAVRIPADVTWE